MFIVRESISLYEQEKLNLAAGLVIIQNNQILLIHPTGASWWRTYSIPKGHVEPQEDLLGAALRETSEETGLDIGNLDVMNPDSTDFIDYVDSKGKVYKRVYYFLAHPRKEIKKEDIKLQREEIDWAGFVNKRDAEKRIHPRFISFLNFLD